MTDSSTYQFVVALGAPQPGAQTPVWVTLFPFALMLAVFYVLVLLPMRRNRKKIQEFQDSIKVGDKVITTSGLYGQVTKITDVSVQLQIAEKVRIDVAKASIGGYQGQDPVVKDAGGL